MPTQAPIEIALPTVSSPPLSKGDREALAFRRLLPQLLAEFPGEYVAIHDERVVDHDRNDVALIQRVHARLGYVPIHVALVATATPIVRIPHYREYRDETGK